MHEKTQEILDIFHKISGIPRCSTNEERIGQWLEQWGKNNGFTVRKDHAGNLVINIPATPGSEDKPGIVLQGHMDMVCEKTPDSDHDFSKDPIRIIHEGDWLKADKTTLGADNGIAIGIALAIAADDTIAHPTLELLFTVDEESGLTGANRMESGFIHGRILINIDSEDEGVFTVGCAGGEEIRILLPLNFSSIPDGFKFYELTAHGIRGGHSGIDIHKNRANANKILARALDLAIHSLPIRLVSFKGGKAHNAIPREAEAVIACDPAQFPLLQDGIRKFEQTAREEYALTERTLAFSLSETKAGAFDGRVLTPQDTRRVFDLLLALPDGVSRMSPEIEGLVETSNNLATVEIKENFLSILSSQRSCVPSRLKEIGSKIKAIASLAGAAAKSGNAYPPWQPEMTSPLLKRCEKTYQQLFNRNPEVKIIHAGLECGIIGSKYPGMDMISIGPTIKNPHSPDEKLFIPSIAPVRNFIAELLESYAR
ncbi:MAG TPA: aminoacyl-histidine dipeptidase [Desulfobacterales bacterium]|nr:aminoacyl-histidine dipeptidase [Desulfobacterales bacterium]